MIFLRLGNYLLPVVVLFIIVYAIRKKVSIYDSFIAGAKEGIELGISVLPYLVAMLFATNILLKSNFLENIFQFMDPVFSFFKIPIEILPMALIRPISGNASFAVMIDIIKTYGVDSYLGRLAATLQGATDTTIYVLSLYFGSIGIKKIGHAMWAGLLTDLMAVIISIILVSVVFG
ncbi:MAG: spore maturation protein [Bacilli bacterium]|nr:spore maturation protein [Bacilli bacterium]